MLWRLGDVNLTKVVTHTLPLDTLSDLELLRAASAYRLAKTNFYWIAPPLVYFSQLTPHRTPTPTKFIWVPSRYLYIMFCTNNDLVLRTRFD